MLFRHFPYRLLKSSNTHLVAVSKKELHCRCFKAPPTPNSSNKPCQRLFSNQTSSSTNGQKSLIIWSAAALATGTGLYLFWKKPKTNQLVEDVKEIAVPTIPLVEGLPEEIPFLIVGGGPAGFAAFRAIRSNDPKAKVLVITDEDKLPYMKPPLSKELWFSEPDLVKRLFFRQWSGRERSIYFEKEEYFCSVADLTKRETGGVAFVRGHRVVAIDPTEQIVTLDNGQQVKYGKCLLATGGRPKSLEIFDKAMQDTPGQILLYRTADDFLNLVDTVEKVKSVTIIGGGFLGSELACAVGRRSKILKLDLDLHQIFPEPGNLSKVLPSYLSDYAISKVRAEGVEVLPNTSVSKVSKKGGKVSLELSNGSSIDTDIVVVAIGSEPDTSLAKNAGLEINPSDGGYLVNAELEARSNLWVAGGASSFYDVKLGRRRVEHHDHAIVSGRLAGQNMAGLKQPYVHQSMLWSDIGPEIGFEAVGLIDSSLPTKAIFVKQQPIPVPTDDVKSAEEKSSEPSDKTAKPVDDDSLTSSSKAVVPSDYEKGIVFYLRDNVIVGIMLWNVFNRLSIARRILKNSQQYNDLSEVAKFFDLYDTQEDEE